MDFKLAFLFVFGRSRPVRVKNVLTSFPLGGSFSGDIDGFKHKNAFSTASPKVFFQYIYNLKRVLVSKCFVSPKTQNE